jgi:hypothetical protein
MRKTRLFQHDAYIAIDFFEKDVEIIRLKNVTDESELQPLDMVIDLGEGKGKKQIFFEKPEIVPINAIKTELERFCYSIENNTKPHVTIIDGYKALDVAYKIIEKINIPD